MTVISGRNLQYPCHLLLKTPASFLLLCHWILSWGFICLALALPSLRKNSCKAIYTLPLWRWIIRGETKNWKSEMSRGLNLYLPWCLRQGTSPPWRENWIGHFVLYKYIYCVSCLYILSDFCFYTWFKSKRRKTLMKSCLIFVSRICLEILDIITFKKYFWLLGTLVIF